MTKFVLLMSNIDEPVYVNPATISCISNKSTHNYREKPDPMSNIYTVGDENPITVKGTPAEVVAEIMRQQEGGDS